MNQSSTATIPDQHPAIGMAARLDDAAADLPFGDLVPFSKMTGANDENRVKVWVNRRLVTHIERWQEWNRFTTDRTGAEHTYVWFGETLLKIAEPLSYVATALQAGQS